MAVKSTAVEASNYSDTKGKKAQKPKSLWGHAWTQLSRDKVAMLSLTIFALYTLVAFLSVTGLIASDWKNEVGLSYGVPSRDHWFGLDIFGRSVFAKTIKGTEVAMSVGFVVATISACIGIIFGSFAGFYGGKIDELIVWFYTVVSSVPNIMLVMAIALISGKGIHSVYLALGLTTWVNLCRLIRAEVIRHKDREYVQAAAAIGGGDFRKLFKHVLPNVFHIVIINFTLTFQIAIKSEVILSYLGLGVQGRPSWGVMINDAKLELARGYWWQLAAATFAMFFVLLALNILGDALRDSLDPKLKGK